MTFGQRVYGDRTAVLRTASPDGSWKCPAAVKISGKMQRLTGKVGDTPIAQILIERTRIAEHSHHIRDTTYIPTAYVLVGNRKH